MTAASSNLDAPWSTAFDGRTALLSERDSGPILELDSNGAAREVGVVAGAKPRGEGGLLGIAVHEHQLYACFTAGDEIRLARYELTGEAGALGLGASEAILPAACDERFHGDLLAALHLHTGLDMPRR